MTVLAEYQRLEAEGIWRATPGAQRRDVIVSIGKATLTLSTSNGTALTHWSLPAVMRLNPEETPAIFGPGREPSETLEIDDIEMVQAIDKVLAALKRKPGRSKWIGRGARLLVLAGAIAGMTVWLPGAITVYTARLVPDVMQREIGEQILAATERVSGAPCTSPAGDAALERLTERLFPNGGVRLVVLPSTLKTTAYLPNGTILISHTLVEDFEAPEVVAGFVIAESQRAKTGTALGDLLEASPFRASLALLSTGHLRDNDIERMAEWLVVRTPTPVDEAKTAHALDTLGIYSLPYAYALDISGESTPVLLSNSYANDPVLSEADWTALQSICSG